MAEGIITYTALAPFAAVAALVDSGERSSRTAFATPSTPVVAPVRVTVQPVSGQPFAVRECRPGVAICEVRVACPPDAAQCRVPEIDRTCPAGQSCTFTVPRS